MILWSFFSVEFAKHRWELFLAEESLRYPDFVSTPRDPLKPAPAPAAGTDTEEEVLLQILILVQAEQSRAILGR